MSKPSRAGPRVIPYGYRLAEEGRERSNSQLAGRQGCRVVPDPITSKTVSRIFHYFAAGQSVHQIAVTLTVEGSPV